MFNFKRIEVEDVKVTKDLMVQKETLIYHTLQGLCDGGKVFADAFLYHPDMGDLMVRAHIGKYDNGVIQIVFELDHKFLMEPILELISAFDKSFEDAIITASKTYYDRVLSVYMRAIQSQSKIKIESKLNEKHKYDLFRSKIQFVGKKKSDFNDLLPYIIDELGDFLGYKRVYYIKVSIAYSDQELVCNAYIDGRLSHCLSDMILDKIEVGKARKDWVEKQYFYLVQDVWTHDASKFSVIDIQEYTKRAITLLQKCFHKHDVDTVFDIIEKKCGDSSLASEIVGLIPELFCKYLYPKITFCDRIYLYRDNGGKKTIYASMMYSYPIIDACVSEYITKNKLNKDNIMSVLKYSGNASVIAALHKDKQNLNDLKIQGFIVNTKKQYVLR